MEKYLLYVALVVCVIFIAISIISSVGGNKMNEKLKKKYGFKFMPGDKVYAIFDNRRCGHLCDLIQSSTEILGYL